MPPVDDRPLHRDKTKGSEFVLESSIQKCFFLSSSFRQSNKYLETCLIELVIVNVRTAEGYQKLMIRSVQALLKNERIYFQRCRRAIRNK